MEEKQEENRTGETKNMELWNTVCKTNPDDTKPFRGKGGFKGTAIAAQSQRKRATELWGSFGGNWGIRDECFSVMKLSEDHHDSIMAYSGILYYPSGSFGIHSDIDMWMYVKSYKSWVKNNDIHKKVRTDAFTKGLSELGFNADVFMGMHDDSKYVESLKEAFEEKITEKQIEEIKKLLKDTDTDETKFSIYLTSTFKTPEYKDLSAANAKSLIVTLKTKLEKQEKK